MYAFHLLCLQTKLGVEGRGRVQLEQCALGRAQYRHGHALSLGNFNNNKSN